MEQMQLLQQQVETIKTANEQNQLQMEQQEVQRQNEAQKILFEQQNAAKAKQDAEAKANEDQLRLQ